MKYFLFKVLFLSCNEYTLCRVLCSLKLPCKVGENKLMEKIFESCSPELFPWKVKHVENRGAAAA